MTKNILVGITGGIAAYKSVELVRLLRDAGYFIRVVMTKHATAFVTPFCFQVISGNPVYSAIMDEAASNGMRHIELAKWADIILIAPASANTIAKMAHGLADDLLSIIYLASDAPLYIAPAMNKQMWENAAVKENIQRLQSRGVILIGPASGEQACGDVGFGRMSEPEQIAAQLTCLLQDKLFWKNKKILITAGPTHEMIDPVRYIANKSSGKIGYALAEAAAQLGAEVVLVSGPTHLSAPRNVTRIATTSAKEMYNAVFAHINNQDIFIGAAAVANYRLETISMQKVKSGDATLPLFLIQNPDIIESVARLNNRPFVVGFAAETNNVIAYAESKLNSKKLDMIIANDVSENKAMGSDTNTVTVIDRSGNHTVLTEAPKTIIARQLLLLIETSILSGQQLSH